MAEETLKATEPSTEVAVAPAPEKTEAPPTETVTVTETVTETVVVEKDEEEKIGESASLRKGKYVAGLVGDKITCPQKKGSRMKYVLGFKNALNSMTPASETVEKTETCVEEDKKIEVTEEKIIPVTEESPAVVEESPATVVEPEEVSIWGIPLLADERSDVVLLKFLRARDFKVKEAFAMLKSVVAWRKEFDIESLLNEDLGCEQEKVVYMHGTDKEGHPVCYNAYGEYQNKELYNETFSSEEKRTKFLRWRIQFLEKSIRKLDFSPDGVCTIVQVVDFKNSPGPFKWELRQATNQAFQLYIAPELVPVQYGGLSREGEQEFTASDSVTEDIIKPATKHCIEFPVTETCTLVWEARVVGYEITYGAEFVPSDEAGYTVIVQKARKISAKRRAILCAKTKRQRID
ncbi:cellular retinaldehyde binding/alpha-tocopherol transport [Tanacetum coccineum]